MTFTGNILYDILGYILLVIFGWAGVKLSQYLGTKLSKTQRELVEGFTKQVVLFVQQKYEELDGEEKFDKAYQAISEFLATKKINLSADQIEVMIESALKNAKNEFEGNWSKETSKEIIEFKPTIEDKK